MNIIEANNANIYDYYAVLDELLALFYQDQQRYGKLFIQTASDVIDEYLYGETELYFIEANDEIVGFAEIFKADNTVIRRMFVLDEYQRQGFGTELVNHLINKYQHIDVDYFYENRPAQIFWSKFNQIEAKPIV
jgi:acetyltransferase, GNAT family